MTSPYNDLNDLSSSSSFSSDDDSSFLSSEEDGFDPPQRDEVLATDGGNVVGTGNSNTNTTASAAAEEERALAARLQRELEELRVQSRTALDDSWAEVERLQRDGSVSRERMSELEGQLARLRAGAAAAGGGGGGGGEVGCAGAGTSAIPLDFVFDGSGGGEGGGAAPNDDEEEDDGTAADSREEGSAGRMSGGFDDEGGGRTRGMLARVDRDNRDCDPQSNEVDVDAEPKPPRTSRAERRFSTGSSSTNGVGGIVPTTKAGVAGDKLSFQNHLHDNLANALAITQLSKASLDYCNSNPPSRPQSRRQSCGGRVQEVGGGGAAPPAPSNILSPQMLQQLAILGQRADQATGAFNEPPPPVGATTTTGGVDDAAAPVDVDALRRTTALQSSTVEALKRELAQLQHEAVREDGRMRAEMNGLDADDAANRERAAALEAEIAKLEVVLDERKAKEEELAEELAALEEQAKVEEQKAQDQIAELEEKLHKKREACSQIERENELLRQSCNEEFEALRQDLMEFLPLSKSEELIGQLMEQFAALKEKEEVLAEELAARMQDRQEILAALEKVAQVGKRVDAVVEAVEDLIEQLHSTGGGGGGGGGDPDAMDTSGDEQKNSYPDDRDNEMSSPEYQLNDRDVAIACLNKALAVPRQIKESLNIVEGELVNLLDSMEVNGKHRPHNRQDSSSDALDKAALLQEEAKEALKEVEAELMDLLASLEEHSGDVVDELEAELASKDAKLASLESTTARQEHTIESLTAELSRLQASSKEESQSSLAVMENLQREVNTIVEGIAEKDQMISTLTKVLEEREANKAALQKELTDIRGKLTTLDPACPRDQCHAVL